MSNVAAWSARAADRRRRRVLFAAVLVAIARLPKDKRFQEHAITLVIGLAAAAAIARESQARSLARLADWDQRRNLRDLRTVNKSRP